MMRQYILHKVNFKKKRDVFIKGGCFFSYIILVIFLLLILIIQFVRVQLLAMQYIHSVYMYVRHSYNTLGHDGAHIRRSTSTLLPLYNRPHI